MNTILLLVATAALGVDVGWEPLSDGGVEYIIQIEPQWLDSLAKDHDVSSDLPVGLDVRRFRITVGTRQLPRIMPAAPAARPIADRTSDTRRSQPAGPPPSAGSAPLAPIASGGNPNLAVGAEMGVPQPIAQPPLSKAATAPAGADPTLAAPTVAGPANAAPTAGSTSGPALGPAMGPALEPPAAIADRQRAAVSRALDDPNAPGRNPLAETTQPKLPTDGLIAGNGPPRTLDPDPTSEQLAEYKATQHEAQRQNERGAGSEHAGVLQPGSDRAAGENPAGGHAVSQFGASQSTASTAHEPVEGAAKTAGEAPAEKPWPAMMGAVTMLLVSISANVYLAWVAWESRLRYRELLAEHGSSPMTA